MFRKHLTMAGCAFLLTFTFAGTQAKAERVHFRFTGGRWSHTSHAGWHRYWGGPEVGFYFAPEPCYIVDGYDNPDYYNGPTFWYSDPSFGFEITLGDRYGYDGGGYGEYYGGRDYYNGRSGDHYGGRDYYSGRGGDYQGSRYGDYSDRHRDDYRGGRDRSGDEYRGGSHGYDGGGYAAGRYGGGSHGSRGSDRNGGYSGSSFGGGTHSFRGDRTGGGSNGGSHGSRGSDRSGGSDRH